MYYHEGVVGTTMVKIQFPTAVSNVVIINDNATGSDLEVFLSNSENDKIANLKPSEFITLNRQVYSIYIKGRSGNVQYRIFST